MTTYRNEDGKVFTEEQMRSQRSRDVASLDIDEDEGED